MNTAHFYDSLGGLLAYPGEGFRQRVMLCMNAALDSEANTGAAKRLADFFLSIEKLSTDELQELYTRTFDLDPAFALDLGWHLFGENYDRGTFLVRMRGQLRKHSLAESNELPDHVTHVLAVLGRMQPDEADDFAEACVLPALDRIRAAFRGKENPYGNVVEAVAGILENRHVREPRSRVNLYPALPVLNERELQ